MTDTENKNDLPDEMPEAIYLKNAPYITNTSFGKNVKGHVKYIKATHPATKDQPETLDNPTVKEGADTLADNNSLNDSPADDERQRIILNELLGDDINGGFVRSLCFTVWQLCHNPTHEDGNTDWADDTLPTVQEGVKRIREKINEALSTPPAPSDGLEVIEGLEEAIEWDDFSTVEGYKHIRKLRVAAKAYNELTKGDM